MDLPSHRHALTPLQLRVRRGFVEERPTPRRRQDSPPRAASPRRPIDPLPFDDRAARAFGRVAASLRNAGRETRARSYDAMIAAIALAHVLPLYTANPDDFRGIEGLEVRVVTAGVGG